MWQRWWFRVLMPVNNEQGLKMYNQQSDKRDINIKDSRPIILSLLPVCPDCCQSVIVMAALRLNHSITEWRLTLLLSMVFTMSVCSFGFLLDCYKTVLLPTFTMADVPISLIQSWATGYDLALCWKFQLGAKHCTSLWWWNHHLL